MDKRKHQDFLAICRQNGWKCTSQRLAVYDCVCENYNHPDVDAVWGHIKKSLPAVTRESVYRILNAFAERGILQRLDHVDSARYDCQSGPQGHFICVLCGDIVDFAFPEEALPFAASVGGEVRSVELRISGVCEKCNQLKLQKVTKI